MIIDRYEADPEFGALCDQLGIRFSPEWQHLDALLDDPELFSLFKQDFQQRYPNSVRTGRPSHPVEVLIRALTLKHGQNWSYEQTEEALKNNLLVRLFCRLYFHDAPDDTVLIRWDGLLSAQTLYAIHAKVVEAAQKVKVTRGRKLRVDTTVVESNIHYPTDSALLVDGIRVISRLAGKARAIFSKAQQPLPGSKDLFRNRMRSARRRLQKLYRQSKAKSQAGKAQFKKTYQDLLSIGAASVQQAEQLVEALQAGVSWLEDTAKGTARRLIDQLDRIKPLMDKVIDQTRRRVIEQQQLPGREKLVSLFEPQSAIIKKGKAAKPVEFGRKVRLNETEGGIISSYHIEDGNPCDSTLFTESLDDHEKQFGRMPDLVSTDRGFWDQENEQEAVRRGVKRVVMPKAGHKDEGRRAHEKKRWFRAGLRFRAGIEGRIHRLKRDYGLKRCLNHGQAGFIRWVSWAIIGANLCQIASTLAARIR